MRPLLIKFTIGLLVAFTTLSTASVAKTVHKTRPLKKKGQLQTDVRFEENVLQGQYQVPTEAMATVENEKILGDLLGVRKHFKDRLKQAAEQE